MKKFSSTTDELAGRIIPGFIAILALATGIAGYFAVKSSINEPIGYMAFLAPAMLAGLLIFFYLYKPLSISTNPEAITIDRKLSPVSISYSDINSVLLPEAKEMSGAIRTFGNGGLFGYTGKYFKKPFGSMTWYCTQRKNYMILEKKSGTKIVITPDQPQEVLASMKIHAPHLFV